MSKLIVISLMAFIIGIMMLCVPLAFLWALNTLFHLGIPYIFTTWLAGLLLCGPFAWAGTKK